jgi:hypothetical protein
MNPLIATAVMGGTKKVISVGLPLLGNCLRVLFNFINEKGIDQEKTKRIILNKDMKVIENDLSVTKNYIENQVIKITQAITDELSIVKGQNEILFLSNSIEYFLKGHQDRTGIDRGISYALQYDIAAVLNHIRDNQQLRFPGYMLHQCSTLARTIRDYNLFYDSVFNDGHVPDWNQDKATEELERKYGPHGENNPITPYIPYENKLTWLRSKSKNSSSKWSRKLPFFGSNDEILDEAHDALVILSKELIANEALERRIVDKLMHLPDHKLLIIQDKNQTQP